MLAGKRVLGPPRDVQEARNAFAAYERLPHWQPAKVEHLLEAHGLLMQKLVDHHGRFRSGDVGIYREQTLLHMAPPAKRVPKLMADLHGWLARGEAHPLIASCVFHYEFELIHPFSDGNGRMGRLWQTLILSQWKPMLAWLPVETVVRERQAAYYRVLSSSDRASEATPFIEFMLDALLTALRSFDATDQVTGQGTVQVGDQVAKLLKVFKHDESVGAADLMARLDLKHRHSFRSLNLNPALKLGVVSMSAPDSPRSPAQRYRLTDRGLSIRRGH
ncbi:MAG: Fic family protein [Panacagrimonas sp.]